METENALTQEVRFAVVLYGGVSLAIYINGVVQEMLRLVRSTADPAKLTKPLDPIEKVYRKVGQALAYGQATRREIKEDDPVRTRFRIDVISGTSAGGINGIFLAKALANQSSLEAVQNLWFDEGALEKLLNDKDSYDDLPFAPESGARSLLNSNRMYYKLLQAFDSMQPAVSGTQNPDGASPLADEVSLFATTTDIEGVPLPIELFDSIVYERRYRNVFRFQYKKEDGQPARNDFHQDYNPFLAFAARCTSSFPFAFEPMRLGDMDPVLQGNPTYKACWNDCNSNAGKWQPFFRQYLTGSEASVAQPDNSSFSGRAFGDGGYLNNKPFSYAIDALIESESDLPIERKLIYVEPSPEHPELDKQPKGPPNALKNSLDALVTIPGYQTIREDLSRALERNQLIGRVNYAVGQMEGDILTSSTFTEECRNCQPIPEFKAIQEERCLRSYYRLRASDTTDQLSAVVARAYNIEEGTVRYKALRAVIRTWRVENYEKEGALPLAFLQKFDLPYRLRRLRFLLRKLDAYSALGGPSEDESQAAALSARFAGLSVTADQRPEWMNALRIIRPRIAASYKALLSLRRRLLNDELPLAGPSHEEGAAKTPNSTVLQIVRDALGSWEQVGSVLDQVIPTALPDTTNIGSRQNMATKAILREATDPRDLETLYNKKARELLRDQGSELLSNLNHIGDILAARLEVVFQEIHQNIEAELSTDETPAQEAAAQAIRPFYICFDQFDSTTFAMLYGTSTGESDRVDIVRISPEDAFRLQPDVTKRRNKLKGLAVGHFGAFLDRSWRENDLLWGRLDTAERMISLLLPNTGCMELRNQLIDEAQKAILKDFDVQNKIREMALARVSGKQPNVRLTQTTANLVVSALTQVPAGTVQIQNQDLMENWTQLVPDQMDRHTLLKDLARSSEITGNVLNAIAADKNTPPFGVWLTRAGRVLWGFTELAVPRSAWKVASRYWAELLYIMAILLILGGVISASGVLTQFGWSLLGITFVAQVITTWLSAFMQGPLSFKAVKEATLFVAVMAALILVILGVVHSWLWIDHYVSSIESPFPAAWDVNLPKWLNTAIRNLCFAVLVPILAILLHFLTRFTRFLIKKTAHAM